MNQTQNYSSGDLTNLKIILSMANNDSSLEFSPITYNLPTILFDIIPPWMLAVITKWNLVPIGPLLKVGIVLQMVFYIKIQFIVFVKIVILLLHLYFTHTSIIIFKTLLVRKHTATAFVH